MNVLSRFGRWTLGLYGPAVPDELKLTDTFRLETGRTEVRSAVRIPAERARELAARQERQHARISELQLYVSHGEADALEDVSP